MGVATEGGWSVRPVADLGVVFPLGDTEVEGRAIALSARGLVKADIVNKAAFKGALSLRAASGKAFSLALGYGQSPICKPHLPFKNTPKLLKKPPKSPDIA